MEEIWRDIKEYEGIYQVSSLGKVKSLGRVLLKQYGLCIQKEKILTPGNTGGYNVVNLYKLKKNNQYRIHRLVGQAFLGLDIKDPKMFVCHKNDIRNDNRVSNLFLGTCKDNVRDCINKNRFSYPPSNRKYDDKIRIKVKELTKRGYSTREIAKLIGIGKSTVSYINLYC